MKMLKSTSIVIAVGVVLVLAGSLSADTMTIGIQKDNYVIGMPTSVQWQNRGWENTVSIGSHAAGWGKGRGLTQFDTSSIPTGQIIQSATLRLYHYYDAAAGNGWNPPTGNVTSVYRSLVEWAEKTDAYPADGNPDMSNFGYRMVGTGAPGIPWASGSYDDGFDIVHNGPLADGSDFLATATDTKEVPIGYNGGNYNYGWVEFNVTADVAAWYSGANNYGWLIKGNESLNNEGVGYRWDFYSREDTANLSLHPQLVVTYIPEPATMCLLGLGGLTLLRKKIA